MLERMLEGMLEKQGLSMEDVQTYIQAARNRFVDARAFALGGKLSTGEEVPGQLAVMRAMDNAAKEFAAVRAEMAKISTQLATFQPVASAAPAVEKVVAKPAQQQKKGGRA
jgi:hypothetical protein